MRNKRGEGYITTCVLIVALCMLFAVFMSFVTAVNVIRISRRNTKNVLDSFVMLNSTKIYDSLKCYSDQTNTFSESGFRTYFCEYNSLTESGDTLIAITENGDEKYTVKDLNISFEQENELKLKVEYVLSVPVSFGSFDLVRANVPVRVITRFDSKF